MNKDEGKSISKSEEQTEELGKNFGEQLKNGGIITLSGNLGAGKTVFVKGLAKGLGIKNRITSPTFIFWRVYDVKKNSIKHFCHVDLYRLSEETSFENIGIEEYWNREDTICIIEWPEKAKDIPKNKIKYSINIKITGKNIREICINTL